MGEGDSSAHCLCLSSCLFGKRRKGVPMLGGRQRVDVNRVPPEWRKNGRCAQQRRIVGSPLSLCGHFALRGVYHVRTCRALARAPHSKLLFCLHSFTHVLQTFVPHVIRGEDLCAAPSPPRQVDRVSGSSRAVPSIFPRGDALFRARFREKTGCFPKSTAVKGEAPKPSPLLSCPSVNYAMWVKR